MGYLPKRLFNILLHFSEELALIMQCASKRAVLNINYVRVK